MQQRSWVRDLEDSPQFVKKFIMYIYIVIYIYISIYTTI